MRRAVPFLMALALSLLPSATASAQYFADCDGAGGYNNGDVLPRVARDRGDIQNNLFLGAYGRAEIKDIRSCSSPDGPSTLGKTIVLPANITASNNWLVQLGYGRQDCPTGYSCWPDDQRVFLYTPSDITYGVLSPFPNAEVPQLGHIYSFKIESSATGFWTYMIHDLTDNQSWVTSKPQTFGSGVSTFYGFEVARYWDQLGLTIAAKAQVNTLEYRRSDMSPWQILTDDPYADCVPSSNVCFIDEALYIFHHAYVSNAAGPWDPDQTFVNAFTDNH